MLDTESSRGELLRYIANGLFATVVHFSVLWLCLEVLLFPWAGLSNAIGACIGMAASFLGLRYFVFSAGDRAVGDQLMRFLALYAAIAVLHGVFLLLWSDILHWDYRVGFLLASGMQFVLSYSGNKALVFDK